MSIQKTYNLLVHLYLMISDSLLARDKVVKNRNGGLIVVAVQSLSHVRLFATPWTAAGQDLLSSSISWGELKFMPIELVMLSNHLNLYHPLLLLPSIFPSIRYFPMSWLLASGGQSIAASVSTSVLPMNIQDFL